MHHAVAPQTAAQKPHANIETQPPSDPAVPSPAPGSCSRSATSGATSCGRSDAMRDPMSGSSAARRSRRSSISAKGMPSSCAAVSATRRACGKWARRTAQAVPVGTCWGRGVGWLRSCLPRAAQWYTRPCGWLPCEGTAHLVCLCPLGLALPAVRQQPAAATVRGPRAYAGVAYRVCPDKFGPTWAARGRCAASRKAPPGRACCPLAHRTGALAPWRTGALALASPLWHWWYKNHVVNPACFPRLRRPHLRSKVIAHGAVGRALSLLAAFAAGIRRRERVCRNGTATARL